MKEFNQQVQFPKRTKLYLPLEHLVQCPISPRRQHILLLILYFHKKIFYDGCKDSVDKQEDLIVKLAFMRKFLMN